jgi:cytochrome c biogenesis factor
MFVPGVVALWAAFLALLGSTFYYWRALRGDDTARERARQAYSLASFAVVLAMGVLLYLILAHDFRVNYVYSYSDLALPTPYLVSTLWAGQGAGR